MKPHCKHPLAHCVSVGRRRRGRKLGVALMVGLILGAYFLIKVLLPTLAGLLDGVFATVVERVGRRAFEDEV